MAKPPASSRFLLRERLAAGTIIERVALFGRIAEGILRGIPFDDGPFALGIQDEEMIGLALVAAWPVHELLDLRDPLLPGLRLESVQKVTEGKAISKSGRYLGLKCAIGLGAGNQKPIITGGGTRLPAPAIQTRNQS